MPSDLPCPTTVTLIDTLGHMIEERTFPTYEAALAFADEAFKVPGRSVELRRQTEHPADVAEQIDLLGRKDYL